MLRAGSCTPEGTNWSFGVQDATLIFFQVLPVLGCNRKRSQPVGFFFSFPSVTEDSRSSGTLINMWMTCLFNLSLFIVYQLELCICNKVIHPHPPAPPETLAILPTHGEEESAVSLPFSNLFNKFHIQYFFFCGRLIIAIVSLFHPVLMHFPQFYTVLA